MFCVSETECLAFFGRLCSESLFLQSENANYVCLAWESVKRNKEKFLSEISSRIWNKRYNFPSASFSSEKFLSNAAEFHGACEGLH